MQNPLHLLPIRDMGELERLAGPWTALHARVPGATPFQSPAWLIPWWRHLGAGALEGFAAWRGEALVALLPAYVWTAANGERELLLLGSGTTDYLDAVVDPAVRPAMTAGVARWLADTRERWDVCHLLQLRPDSLLLEVPVPSTWDDHRGDGDPCPALPLPRGRTVDQILPQRLLQNARYDRRRALRRGDVMVQRATADDAEFMFDALARLHSARWRARDGLGVLHDHAIGAAHRETVAALARRDMLRLYTLTIGGALAAALYAVRDGVAGGRVYYYIGGFDPAFAALSPGTLLIVHAIEEALAEGAAAFDFLRGREPYKYRFGARDERTFNRSIRPRP